MRLIDADALIKDIYAQSDDDGWFVVTAQELEELVNGQPTIEAVPTGCEGCVYDVDDHTPDPCYECKRSYIDNYKERTDETD